MSAGAPNLNGDKNKDRRSGGGGSGPSPRVELPPLKGPYVNHDTVGYGRWKDVVLSFPKFKNSRQQPRIRIPGLRILKESQATAVKDRIEKMMVADDYCTKKNRSPRGWGPSGPGGPSGSGIPGGFQGGIRRGVRF